MTDIRVLIAALLLVVLQCEGRIPWDTILDCSGEEIKEKSFQCHVSFFVELKGDPHGNCSAMYERMANCSNYAIINCVADEYRSSHRVITTILSLLASTLDALVIYCQQGGLQFSTLAITNAQVCTEDFGTRLSACTDEYHVMFSSNPADSALCRKYDEAMDCASNTVDMYCYASERERIKQSFNHGNPVCEADRILLMSRTTSYYPMKLSTERTTRKISAFTTTIFTESPTTTVTEETTPSTMEFTRQSTTYAVTDRVTNNIKEFRMKSTEQTDMQTLLVSSGLPNDKVSNITKNISFERTDDKVSTAAGKSNITSERTDDKISTGKSNITSERTDDKVSTGKSNTSFELTYGKLPNDRNITNKDRVKVPETTMTYIDSQTSLTTASSPQLHFVGSSAERTVPMDNIIFILFSYIALVAIRY